MPTIDVEHSDVGFRTDCSLSIPWYISHGVYSRHSDRTIALWRRIMTKAAYENLNWSKMLLALPKLSPVADSSGSDKLNF